MTRGKRKAEGEVVKKMETTSSRVTRSSTRRSNGGNDASESMVQSPELPNNKKAKRGSAAAKKAGSVNAENVKAQLNVKEAPAPAAKLVDCSKAVVIEHCKQCHQFKKRAIQVKDGLEKGLSGVTVLLNPEKPRRGCFEIREEGGEKFISLLDMKRPFGPMRALDMDKVISDIIDKMK